MTGIGEPYHGADDSRAPRMRAVLRALPPPLRHRIVASLSSVGAVASTDGSVALTFDDGPDPVITPAVLDVLAAHDVRATFFVLADRAELSPLLVRRILDEGHDLGLHGASHTLLTAASLREVARCIWGGKRRLEAVAGQPVRLFRPPYGRQDARSFLVARAARLRIIAWSVQADDWLEAPLESVVARWVSRAVPGAFLLVHDGVVAAPDQDRPVPCFDRAEMVERLVSGLRERGLVPRPVADLLATTSPVEFPWFSSRAHTG